MRTKVLRLVLVFALLVGLVGVVPVSAKEDCFYLSSDLGQITSGVSLDVEVDSSFNINVRDWNGEYQTSNTYVKKQKKKTSITWSSSKESVATVSKGKIKTKSIGSTTIVCKIGKLQTIKFKVNVLPKDFYKFVLTKGSVELGVGDKERISLGISGGKAYDGKIKWKSDNPEVATVSQLGKITGISKGSTTVYAKIGSRSWNCSVTVTDTPTKVKEIKQGTVLYKDDKVTIKFHKIEKDWTGDPVVKFLVENRYSKSITIQCDYIVINGFTFDSILMSDDVGSGKSAVVEADICDFDSSLTSYKTLSNLGADLNVLIGWREDWLNSTDKDVIFDIKTK